MRASAFSMTPTTYQGLSRLNQTITFGMPTKVQWYDDESTRDNEAYRLERDDSVKTVNTGHASNDAGKQLINSQADEVSGSGDYYVSSTT